MGERSGVGGGGGGPRAPSFPHVCALNLAVHRFFNANLRVVTLFCARPETVHLHTDVGTNQPVRLFIFSYITYAHSPSHLIAA